MQARVPFAALGLAAVIAAAGACASPNAPAACPPGKVAVVAAENFWGSIAGQLGGDRVCVSSVLSNPATDPHDYDATPADARLLARSRYVIVNGAGYDPWARRLLSANPVAGRETLDVGELVGVPEGGNPHLWYSPAYVGRVVDRVASDLGRLDPAGAAYFEARANDYRTVGLKAYLDAIAAIQRGYAGVAVGASESIFVYLAQATGLNLVTPPGYLKAITAGSEPSPADKAVVDEQLAGRQVRVFVFNSQNSTPDVRSAVDRARRAGIPVVQMTETLSPATLTFQDWQAGQLRSLLAALGG